jgi:N4-gp56 family major capsid protein
MQYNDPRGGDDSNIGTQFNVDYYKKQALIEVKKEMFFGQMADTTNMPKNMGKTIKLYHYLPLLDDSNINDQGLDAAGASVNQKVSIPVTRADGSIPYIPTAGTYILGATAYIIGEGATDQLAGAEAILNFNLWAESSTASGGLGVTLVGGDEDLKFWDAVNPTDGLVYVKGFRFGGLELLATGTVAAGVDALAVPESGNLYGSSKDVGTIAAKLPLLSENGGRVNRVGFKRREIEGSIIKFGFFDEYTKESVDFDTDSQLQMHINREMIFGANEITEDALQIDLLNGAGIVRFGGAALQTSDLQGNTGGNGADLVTYNDLMKLSIDLDNNRCPKDTEIITGTRIIDTRVVNAARYMYIGTELTPMVKKMTDNFSKQAFISVEKYASGATLARGEIGTVDQFRIIVVPEMMHYSGAGATVATNAGYRETNGKYDVFPMLVVGSKSFTTIGFQTDGKTVKFKIKHSKPESDISYANDPYGETGFMSIKWYYGSIITRPERIALVKTVAEW